jgi:hypothetical protein
MRFRHPWAALKERKSARQVDCRPDCPEYCGLYRSDDRLFRLHFVNHRSALKAYVQT